MITETRAYLEKYHMLPPGSRVLCAVSGGADSMCLAHLLASLRQELGIELTIAHYEHGIRGEESKRDCAFVESWCAENGLAFVCEHGDVPGYAEKMGLGMENAARRLRYEFLERTADKLGCDKIATAHNADDNAETVIFNLCRGTGASGLRGIAPVKGRLIRPLLWAKRTQIEEYLCQNGVKHIEDSSNECDDYSRNLIRHKVSPVLRSINENYASAIASASELIALDEDCLDSQARAFLSEHFTDNSVGANELRALHPAVAARVIRLACPQTLSRGHVESILKLTEKSELGYADVPGLRVSFQRGRLYFGAEEKTLPTREIMPGKTVAIPELGLEIRAEYTDFSKEINNSLKTYYFKCENIAGKVFCTSRQEGDKISLIGRNCTKTLKKLYTELGLSQNEKALTPVFRDERGVLAVYPYGADKRAAARTGDRVLKIEIIKSGEE